MNYPAASGGVVDPGNAIKTDSKHWLSYSCELAQRLQGEEVHRYPFWFLVEHLNEVRRYSEPLMEE